ncbi:MAG TPA: NAD(P)H-binding protein [Gammaproteobacteria bacterium]|nr:NAD(P)H-binding protein [Gammaproteobacteria bacterium]
MKVALFGGTGYVGGYLVDALLEHGHTPRLLVRAGSEAKVREPGRCEVVTGEIGAPAAVAACLEGADAAIYNIGLLREFPRQGITWEAMHYAGAARCIDAALSGGVGRFILMSANGARPEGTGYQATKYRAEQYLAGSGLDWTVFRPSVVFGDPRGQMEFCTQLRDEMILRPIPAPLFHKGLWPGGAGRFRMSPVAVENLAAAFARALETSATHGRILPLCGPEALEWREILRIIAAAVGRRKLMLPAPVGVVRAAATLLDGFGWFPVTRPQLQMLLEGNTCDGREAWRMFGIEPARFTVESLGYLRVGKA